MPLIIVLFIHITELIGVLLIQEGSIAQRMELLGMGVCG
jgi:hypothetical protein